jgi:cytoskeletal protein RodZ
MVSKTQHKIKPNRTLATHTRPVAVARLGRILIRAFASAFASASSPIVVSSRSRSSSSSSSSSSSPELSSPRQRHPGGSIWAPTASKGKALWTTTTTSMITPRRRAALRPVSVRTTALPMRKKRERPMPHSSSRSSRTRLRGPKPSRSGPSRPSCC